MTQRFDFSTMGDLYKDLGVNLNGRNPQDVPMDELKGSFRGMASKNHPDKLDGLSDAEKAARGEAMAKANRAKSVLIDDPKARYDYHEYVKANAGHAAQGVRANAGAAEPPHANPNGTAGSQRANANGGTGASPNGAAGGAGSPPNGAAGGAGSPPHNGNGAQPNAGPQNPNGSHGGLDSRISPKVRVGASVAGAVMASAGDVADGHYKDAVASAAGGATASEAFLAGAKIGAQIPGPAALKAGAGFVAGAAAAIVGTEVVSRGVKAVGDAVFPAIPPEEQSKQHIRQSVPNETTTHAVRGGPMVKGGSSSPAAAHAPSAPANPVPSTGSAVSDKVAGDAEKFRVTQPSPSEKYEAAKNAFEAAVKGQAHKGQFWSLEDHNDPKIAAVRKAFSEARAAVVKETPEARNVEVQKFENMFVKQAGGTLERAPAPAAATPAKPHSPHTPAPTSGDIIVKPGDNLGKIAGTLDAAWAQTAAAIGGKPDDLTVRLALGIALAKRNDIAKPDHITKGQVLHVPTKEEIQKTVEELKKGLLKNDNAITVDEYKTQIKNHTMAEILAPAATPAAPPQSAPPSRA